MQHAALFLSVKPMFINRILAGTKNIELRRVRPHVNPGDTVLLYSSSPTMALVASAKILESICDSPKALWERVKNDAGISRREYDVYFEGATTAVGIRLGAVQQLDRPLPLHEIRQLWPWFRPPQSYRYVDAHFELNGSQVASLAPSSTVARRQHSMRRHAA